MTSFFDTQKGSGSARRRAAVLDGIPDDMLSPVLAGAQARGMVDAFDMMGVPVVFIRRDGSVLNVNGLALEALGSGLTVQSDHLVAASPAANQMLSRFMTALLSQPDDAGWSRMALSSPDGDLRPTIYGTTLPLADAMRGQILRAILVLDDGRAPAVAAYFDRMAAMPRRGRTACAAA